MFKSNGGFTLVELIVVIAILGLLAGIGIPAYSNYISTAEDKIDVYQDAIDQEADDVEAAWNAAFGNAGAEEGGEGGAEEGGEGSGT